MSADGCNRFLGGAMTGKLCAILAALLLAGCSVTRNDFLPAETMAAPSGVSLRGKTVYIYCFLDIRAKNIGRAALAKFDVQLTDALHAAGVLTQSLHFSGDGSGADYSSDYLSVPVPVAETIARNAAQEKAAGAAYRLILFPAASSRGGNAGSGFRAYAIRWDLVDVASGKRIWATASIGSHADLFFSSETKPEDRTGAIVDGFMAELKKTNLL